MIALCLFTLLCLTSFSSVLAPTAQSDAQFHIDETQPITNAKTTFSQSYQKMPILFNIIGYELGNMIDIFLYNLINMTVFSGGFESFFFNLSILQYIALSWLINLPVIFMIWYNYSNQRSFIGYFLNGIIVPLIIASLMACVMGGILAGYEQLILIPVLCSYILMGSFIYYCCKRSQNKIPKKPGKNQKKRLLSYYRTVEV